MPFLSPSAVMSSFYVIGTVGREDNKGSRIVYSSEKKENGGRESDHR